MAQSRGPTLINLPPPPPADPVTPSGPGTPNSGTTSLSTLSVVAIKDGSVGHSGHIGRPSHSSASTLDAERADRISRLAGLERVAGSRQSTQGHLNPSLPPGYFDSNVPQIKERSTVGSASATGSVGGRTTWASGSVDDDDDKTDKMSEDQDDGVSSTGGLSDEGNASLVGFGEGASSTMSGPISTAAARAHMARQQTPTSRMSGGTPMSGVAPTGTGTATGAGQPDARMMDGVSYEAHDTVMPNAPPELHSRGVSGVGTDMAESIISRTMDVDPGERPMGTPGGRDLGKFPFE